VLKKTKNPRIAQGELNQGRKWVKGGIT